MKTPKNKQSDKQSPNEGIRLNKFIANAGVCSRREADKLIEQGLIKVNGRVVKEMGFKVTLDTEVIYKGKRLIAEELKYVLLNKPKDFISANEDEKGRKTVMGLVKKAGNERLFPVGRLDRSATGLLLLTNDGVLAKKLSNPSSKVPKVYQVELNKALEEEDLEKIKKGIQLQDDFIKVDEAAIITEDGLDVGIEIHSGKNAIVKRIFEHLGYEVNKLDRVLYGGLTKKDLPRGKWRFLKPIEVIRLKGIR